MLVDVLTLFPEMLSGAFGESMVRIAQDKGLLTVRVTDIRDFAEDKHRTVDDRPYGGGPGMVLKPGPVFRAVEAVEAPPARKILLSPQGRAFDQTWARELAQERHLVLVCGHYEGFDERIVEGLGAEELSIGDYVLSGGEPAAFVVVDAITRLIPGVLGDPESAKNESFETGLLDCPHYTRPPVFREMRVPEILLSGDHQKIAEWRRQQAEERTRRKRPDLFEGPTANE